MRNIEWKYSWRGGVTLLAFAIALNIAAQSKVDAPRLIHLRYAQGMSGEQVRRCLYLAKEISDLTDRAKIADARGDVETFNSTVDPYNSAISQWNAGCITPYDPAEMIRAENENGMRLCEFTRTPCMSDAKRLEILAREAARQRESAAHQSGLRKSSNPIKKLSSASK